MENRKKTENISLIAIMVAIISVPLYLMINSRVDNISGLSEAATYVGRETCIECHLNEHNQWIGSHHDKAMDHANDSTVLGDFNEQALEYNGMTHKMYRKDSGFFVYTDGENGEMEEFEITYVFGFYPLQQYLVEFDGGRLQTLSLTWDSKNHEWYHMAEALQDEIIDHNNWLHWTNQAQNWNGMCADCHSTNVVKGYDVETDTYHTTWSEIDVSCETCHGPSSEHLTWAAKAEYARDENTNYGLVVKTSDISNKEYVDLCVRCHARRGVITDFIHSENIYDHTIPNLPTGEDYFIDGQIKGEVYVYGSFTQSKMYMQEVQCNDCHNAHSTELLFDDNQLCTQCHQADDYDTYDHHFHKSFGEEGEAVVADDGVTFEVGEGTRCINCHMPQRFYMGVDYRADHSLRIPRPDLSQKLGTPNACNQCHDEESYQWAVDYIDEWHGIGRKSQYGEAFKESRTGSQEGFEGLVNIYQDDVYPEIVRAIAVHLIGMHYQSEGKDILLQATNDINGHIRYYALQNLMMDDQRSINKVLSLLNDQTKAIRIECAAKLNAMGQEQVPGRYREAFREAKDEYLASLKYSADFPSGKFNLANFYYNEQQLDKAETLYEKALKQDSLLHGIKVNLALVYNSKGKYEEAEKLLKDYLKNNPQDGQTMFTYALFLSERKRYNESMEYLLKASELSPRNSRIKYNIAMMYDFRENPEKAEEYLRKAISINPDNQHYYMALLNVFMKYEFTQKAQELAREILEKFPNVQQKEQIEQIATNQIGTGQSG